MEIHYVVSISKKVLNFSHLFHVGVSNMGFVVGRLSKVEAFIYKGVVVFANQTLGKFNCNSIVLPKLCHCHDLN